jgi:hypothetical protein
MVWLVFPLIFPGLAVLLALWFSHKPLPAQKTAWILVLNMHQSICPRIGYS